MAETIKYLDFLHFKNHGKIAYIEYPISELPIENTASEQKSMEDLALTMELSTDELAAEITSILENNSSLRKLPLKVLTEELCSRLKLIEAICILATVANGAD